MRVVTAKYRMKHSLDLSEFRKKYPLTVAALAHLANREAWLHSIWTLDEKWKRAINNGTLNTQEEVLVRGNPPSNLSVAGEFEIIYSGLSGLLHAAAMASNYKRSVLVFDAQPIENTHRDWNISNEELRELESTGLFTKEEIENATVNRYRTGFVKFHDANSKMKAPPLLVENVLNAALDSDVLLTLAANKIKTSKTKSAVIVGVCFVRAYVTNEKIFIEVEDIKTKVRKLYASRLFVDADESSSTVSRQLNNGKSVTHISPTVGTIAKGFVRGNKKDEVNFRVGEILVSMDDASDHRQLIWKGFAKNDLRDEYATYLFFCDTIDSRADKSLLNLFEHYFDSLPRYKRQNTQWRVVKPVFSFISSSYYQGWANQKQTADDRVLLIGNGENPLTCCGIGSHILSLRRLTHLTELAIKADMLDASALSQINSYDLRTMQNYFAEFMRPTLKSKPSVVNETMNAVMSALHSLDESVRRQFFQDKMTFDSLRRMLKRTAKVYPKIFARMKEHFGVKGTFWWLANVAENFMAERAVKKREYTFLTQHEDARQEFEYYIKFYKANNHF